jgi:ferric-dicitrate binding protein FerR (iron transport regulator)
MTSHDPEEAFVAELFSKVEPRAQPPWPTQQAVYLSSLLAWRQEVARRRWRRVGVALAAGLACVVIGTGVLLYRNGALAPPVHMATSTPELPPGAVRETSGSGGFRLQAAGGEGLRLGPGTRYAMQGETLWLLEGAIYVEAGDEEGAGSLVINAGHVDVRHVGTRYAVTFNAGRVEVRVRDGLVQVNDGTGRQNVAGGTLLSIGADGQSSGPVASAAWGPHWAWAEQLAPPLAIDGRMLLGVLEDIAFETGRSLAFEDNAVRRLCEATRLKGPVLDLPASGRLFAVLVTTDLEAVENGDRILIRQQAE